MALIKVYPYTIPLLIDIGTPGGTVAAAAIVANTGALTGALAAALLPNSLAVVQSTNQIFITYDNVNWTALS